MRRKSSAMERSASKLALPGELRHDDDMGGIMCGDGGSVIDTDTGSGDNERGVRAPPPPPADVIDGIASNAVVAAVLNVLRGIAYMLHADYIGPGGPTVRFVRRYTAGKNLLFDLHRAVLLPNCTESDLMLL